MDEALNRRHKTEQSASIKYPIAVRIAKKLDE
jgi:hypothetical protein